MTVLFLIVAWPSLAQTNASHLAVGTVPPDVRDINQIKQRQYVAFDPHYLEAMSNFATRFRPVAKKIFAEEAAGKDVRCAHQIYQEILWLMTSSADMKRMNERLRDLEISLGPSAPYEIKKAAGLECLTEWWWRLDWFYDHVKTGEPIPPEILDRINSPEKLTAHLTPLSVSDIPRTGRDNSWEFNMTCADLIRWIVRDRPGDFHAKLKETLLKLTFQFQDSETGYWGQRYVINGKGQFVPDLSTTFHIVSYLKGRVPHLDKIATTTLATKDMDTPVGWLYKGQTYNHNFMDVAELFKWAWPQANAEQKKAIAAGIQYMLRRCLSESLQPDGSFKHLEADQSIEEATYFGAEFLSRIGFFNKSRRFWTDQNFPEAEGIRQKIIAYIERQTGVAAGGSWYRDALHSLNGEPKKERRKTIYPSHDTASEVKFST
jgi:hypothetical protein